MNDKQENRHTRSTTLLAFYDKFRTPLESNPALDESFKKLIGLHNEVSQKNQIILGGRKAKTLAKASARKDLVIPGIVLSGVLYSLGRDTNDFDMQVRAGIRESDLSEKYRDTEITDVLAGLLSAAKANITKLGKYKLPTGFLSSFEEKLETYKKLSGSKSTESNVFMIVSAQIDKLQSQIAEVIHKELDRKMQIFKMTDPGVYNEYALAKRLPKEGVHHRKKKDKPKGNTSEESQP